MRGERWWLQLLGATDRSAIDGDVGGPPPGQRALLPGLERLQFGREQHGSHVIVAHPAVNRRSAHLRWQEGAWWLEDLGGTNGTFVNGELIHRARVASGDVFAISGAVRFRLVGDPGRPVDDLEDRVAETPADDFRWQVWANALVEAGDPLGRWMTEAAAPAPGRLERALGSLAPLVQVDWAHGFARHARVDLGRAGEIELPLARVLWHPLFRFLRFLTVELGAKGDTGVVRVADRVALQQPRHLERLAVLSDPPAKPRLAELAMSRLSGACPRLTTTAAELVRRR